MSEEVQADDHLAQIANAQAKASKPTTDRSVRNVNKTNIDFGALKERLKEPTVAVLFGLVGLLSLAMLLQSYYYGTEISTAKADSQEAKAFGHQAEREAKLSREDVKNLDIHTQVLTAILQSRGFNPPPAPKLHQESN